MADIKAGEPFGLDGSLVDKINWDLALKRIVNDVRSDFIYAPHLMFLYLKAAQQLVDQLKKELKSGAYLPFNNCSVALRYELTTSARRFTARF